MAYLWNIMLHGPSRTLRANGCSKVGQLVCLLLPYFMGERWGEEKRCSWVSVEQDVDMHDNIVLFHVLPNTQISPNLT